MGENPSMESIVMKSPQELAAQVLSVPSTGIESVTVPRGKEMDEKYKEIHGYVERLLECGISDSTLEAELDRVYEENHLTGVYSPEIGEGAEDAVQARTSRLQDMLFQPEEATLKASKDLAQSGYLGRLREQRGTYEKRIRDHFVEFSQKHQITEHEEALAVANLRERCVNISDPECPQYLREHFPDGNYLFHGTRVEQALSILGSGDLVNAKTLSERAEAAARKEGHEAEHVRRNSGYEGISWNFNEIGALPGDRYHLVGFLAAPKDVLTSNRQLAIPSRPAPHELILVDEQLDVERFYAAKTQLELLFSLQFGESNSVWSSIAKLSFVRQERKAGTDNRFAQGSMLEQYCEKEQEDDEMAATLHDLYSIRANGTIEFSTELFQQVDDSIPVAAVFFQALIDTGRIGNVKGFENTTTVRQIVERIDEDNWKAFIPEFRREKDYVEQEVERWEARISSLAVPVSDMFFVIPNSDLERWLNVLARCEVHPKGILVYDHNEVRLEDFASTHRGDNDSLSRLFRGVLPQGPGYVSYEQQLLGEKLSPDKMTGHRRHVVAEKFLNRRKSLRKTPEGDLLVV